MMTDCRDRSDAFVELFHVEPTRKGCLDGLTVAVKDLFDVAGKQTGCGNPDWARTHRPAERHAPAVETILEAGASLVGKTHTDELAYSLLGINHHYGPPRNSAAPDRIPGGSSSGSAAAVSAGCADVGLGTDTGGSIRVPASFCGLFGLRTSHGAVSLEGVMPLAPSFDTVGWLTRNLGHLRRLLAAYGLTRPAGGRPTVIIAEDIWDRAEPNLVRALQPVVEVVEGRWGSCQRISLSDGNLRRWREVFQICQAAEIWQCHGAWIEQENPAFGPGVRERFERASRISVRDWQDAKVERQAIRTRVTSFLENSVLLVPAAPGPALKRDAVAQELDVFRDCALEMLCPAGLAGCPQLVFPAAEVMGCPVGASVIGAPGTDSALIALVETMTDAPG